MNIEKNKIVETLISQHKMLRESLHELEKQVGAVNPDSSFLVDQIDKFKHLLVEHLRLENNVFYPALLEDMKDREMKTSDTEKFIEKMKDIEKKIEPFFEKYKAEQDIAKDFKLFTYELNEMAVILLLRISAEEDGVYLYWNS